MEIEKEIEEIKKKLESFERRISVLEGKPQQLVSKSLSIKEFLLQKNPKDDTDKTLGIGYYLEKYEGFELFNIKDLEDGFRRAKEKVPININDKVNKNIQKGFIDEAKDKKNNFKAWYLTNSGEKFVENGFGE